MTKHGACRQAIFAETVEAALVGKPLAAATLAAGLAAAGALDLMPEEQYHVTMQPEGKDAYRHNLGQNFLYKFYLKLLGDDSADSLKTAMTVLSSEAGVSTGTQTFATKLPADHPGAPPTVYHSLLPSAVGCTPS